MASGKKSCFVIAPIGREESETRKRSDLVLECIIKPAAEKCGYEAVRADEISEPGVITTQIIQHLMEDDLVIADLTEKNPNVFYELAIRHAVRKPVVQIIKHDENIPFDVVTQRTIHYDTDLKSGTRCIGDLVDQIHAVEENPEAVDSPVSTTIDLKTLRESENPVEKSIVEIVPMLEDIRSMVQANYVRQRDSGIPEALLEEITMSQFYAIKYIITNDIEFLERYVHHLKRLKDFLDSISGARYRPSLDTLHQAYSDVRLTLKMIEAEIEKKREEESEEE